MAYLSKLLLVGMLACLPAIHARAQSAPAPRTFDVRIASQAAVAPKWIQSADGLRGICPEVMAAVERVQPQLHFTGQQQSRSLPAIEAGMLAGRLDAACALMSSPRRESAGRRVGPPVYVMRHQLVARSDDDVVIADVADLARRRDLVASQRGSVVTERLKQAGCRVDDATDDNGINLHKMLAGHGRFAYMNDLTMRHYIASEHLDKRVRILPVTLAAEPAYFWVSHETDPAVAALLGKALDKLKASGELDRIYTRWAREP